MDLLALLPKIEMKEETSEDMALSQGVLVEQPKIIEKPICAVCNHEGDGHHFGVEACRACAAFFRRTISTSKTYECKTGSMCLIDTNIRCMCRSCRFDKCIAVGMNPSCVQQRRDVLGKRQAETTVEEPEFKIFMSDVPSTSTNISPRSLDISYQPSVDTMPILERMMENYRKMENARLVIHQKEGESIFSRKVPKILNFKDAMEITTKEVSLVADWISWCFDDFVHLPMDQKTILFQNFFVFFTMLERSFLTHMCKDRDDVVVMASGDYIEINNLTPFFEGSCPDEQKTEDILKMIKPSFEMQKRSLVNLMRVEKMDIYEFFAMCTMLLWDYGLDKQSDECAEVGRNVRNKVAREMSFYLRFVKKHEEPLLRMSSIVTVLPALQRVVRRFQEDISIARMFNVYKLPDAFYNIVNGKFH